MDVAALRNELEHHLGKNPHEDAPSGFRDRFDAVVAELESGDDDFSREALEAQLRQICEEAEAAAAAGMAEGDSPRVPEPRPEGGDLGTPPRTADRTDPPSAPAEVEAGPASRWLVPLALLVVILAAAYFVLR